MLKNLILAFRPQTLTASVGPILVGFFLALKYVPGKIEIIYLIPIFISALSIQIATNLFNDYIDFKRGSDLEDRLGPDRVTAKKLIHPETVKKWALGFCILALIAGVPIVLKTGWIFVLLGLVSLALAYLYTGTKFSLAYTGAADIFVILFFGCFAVAGTYYTLTLDFSVLSVQMGLQVGALCNVLLVVNNLRDIQQDQNHSKKTLIVRFGRGFGLMEYLGLILFGFLGFLLWTGHLENPLGYILLQSPWFLMSLYLWDWVRRHPPSKHYNKILKFSGLIHFGFCLSMCLGLRFL